MKMDKTQFITELFDYDKIKIDSLVAEALYSAMIEKAKDIIFESKKFMRHSRRKELRPNDIEAAIKKNCCTTKTGLSSDSRVFRAPTQFEDFTSSSQINMPQENPFYSKVEIEWVNLGSEKTVKKEKRFLYDWYRNAFKPENLKQKNIDFNNLDFGRALYPFPNMQDYSEEAEKILKFILYKIRGEHFALIE